MESRIDRGTAVALDESACWSLLEHAEVGRLAVVIAGEPEVFPVNFVVNARSLVFRTSEGTKLFGVTASPRVAFEVDGYDPRSGEVWSVVAKGAAERLERFSDIYAVDELPLAPWHGGVKQWFVRISDVTVSGRAFRVQVAADTNMKH
jgi:uncharacterized protein